MASWKKFFQKLFMWPCSDAVQIDRTLVYSILRAMAQENGRRKLYSNSTEQQPTVTTRLCTVVNLLLYRTTIESGY